MMKNKFVSILLCICLLIPSSSALAVDKYDASRVDVIAAEDITPERITMDDLYLSTPKTLYVSPEVTYMPEGNVTRAGVYPIVSRYRLVQSGSSNGIIERDSKIGDYSSIASIALSFAGYAPTMVASVILSLVGLAASQNTYTQVKTYTSYVQYTKYGESRWSDETNYTAMVLSGQRNHYKHIVGATRDSSTGIWTTQSRDFIETPCTVQSGNYYSNSSSWFTEESESRFVAGSVLYDLPW